MKISSILALIGVAVLVASCSSIAKFPVSTTVPAAEITATKKMDRNKNYVIELKAINLAEASRLDPPMKNYNVWIVVDNGTTKNIGQLINKNAKTAVLKTTTPFDVDEIFITAEEKGDLSFPEGVEISRTSFEK